MHDTRIRLIGAALLFALLAAGARSDETAVAPPPRPVPSEKGPPAGSKTPVGDRTPDEVRGELEHLTREWAARKGALEIAQQRFTARAEELKAARQRLTALKEPEPKTVPPVFGTRDVDLALQAAERIAADRAARVGHLEAVRAALVELLKGGAEFERAYRTADTQYERLGAARELALRHGLPADQLPEGLVRKRLDEVVEANGRAKTELDEVELALTIAKGVATAARAKSEELKAGREAALAGFAFEDQLKGLDERQLIDELVRLRKALHEKAAALKGDEGDYKKAQPLAAEARARRDAIKEPPVPAETKPPAARVPLDEAARQLAAARQYLGGRVRAANERKEKTDALIAALDDEETKAKAYAHTLDEAQRTAARLAAVVAELDERVGRSKLDPAQVPPDAEPGADPAIRARLEADGAAVRGALAQLQAERDALRKTDPSAGTVRGLTDTVLAQVSERSALLTELNARAAEFAAPRRERSESEQKRRDQRAAERIAKEAGRWDWFFALDRSRPATDLSKLLDAYYKELIDLDEKAENLRLQRDALTALIDGTHKEAADIAKLRAVLSGHSSSADVPGSAPTGSETDFLQAVVDKQQWDDWLAARLAPDGLKAEAGIYHDHLARLAALAAVNARRVHALTGNAPPEPWKPGAAHPEHTKLMAAGGEIGKARDELLDAHVRGLTLTGTRIGAVLLVALIVPALVMRVLRRAIRGGTDDAGNPSPVLAALRRVLKLVVWAAAGAVVLSFLGFDVTALVVALAIGALALAVAARPMIADVLGSLAVYADRRFKLGDVVRLGGGDPARVVGLTWRSTALRNNNGLVVSVPNRQLTEASVENLSRGAETYDALAVTISTDKDAGRVIGVIRAAIAQCKNLSPDHGVTVVSFTQRGIVKVVQYRFWWFLKDYEARNKTRDEVFARIAVGLTHEDMNGIELTLA